MLVYVNQIKINGDNALNSVLKTVSGWLKELTKRSFSIDELKKSEDYNLGKQKVRTYSATHADPSLYSILFSNPDSEVNGRQWITEIGISVESDGVLFSILLETSDISTKVTNIPQSSRPKVIKYLQRNCNVSLSTTGISVKNISNSEEDLKALLSEIERNERNYPLVLVSSEFDGRPVVNLRSLQEQLIGLAQVVEFDKSIDSWEMERVLSRRYCAWGGAINVVFPIGRNSLCHRSLLLKERLEEIKSADRSVIGEILSIITHTTNVQRKKKHFSPTDVRAKRQKDQREYLKKKQIALQQSGNYEELLSEAFDQIDQFDQTIESIREQHQSIVNELEMKILELEDSNERLAEKSRAENFTISALKDQLSWSKNDDQQIDVQLIKIISDCLASDPSPEDCLVIVQKLYPSKVKILDTAFESARKSMVFRNGRKLVGLLLKLVTDYIDALSQGGDSNAKNIFGSSYSANESETVEKSNDLRKLRCFKYNDSDIYMPRHLKIGVADNISETIRVHFYWDSSNSLIVIGYCGEHLPIASKSH